MNDFVKKLKQYEVKMDFVLSKVDIPFDAFEKCLKQIVTDVLFYSDNIIFSDYHKEMIKKIDNEIFDKAQRIFPSEDLDISIRMLEVFIRQFPHGDKYIDITNKLSEELFENSDERQQLQDALNLLNEEEERHSIGYENVLVNNALAGKFSVAVLGQAPTLCIENLSPANIMIRRP